MPINANKSDLRIKRTDKALSNALLTLLERRNFVQLTINDLCNEALVSRATFYTHFVDKYDLLEHLLMNWRKEYVISDNTYEQMELKVNQFARKNSVIIKNLIGNANAETLKILSKHLLSIMGLPVENDKNAKINPQNVVLSAFFVGGIIYYLDWQIENKFPKEINMLNPHIYGISKHLLKWGRNQDLNGL